MNNKIGPREQAAREQREAMFRLAKESRGGGESGPASRTVGQKIARSDRRPVLDGNGDATSSSELKAPPSTGVGVTPGPREPTPINDAPRKLRRPLASERHKTISAQKPWEKVVPAVSRTTWYRRQKEAKR